MGIRNKALMASGLCLALSSLASAATYYVSNTGNDANGGSSAAPWQTLQHAANQVGPGDTVIVRAGTYKGMQITTSGTAINRIVFTADSGVVVNDRCAARPDGINLEGASYVTIEGFTVRNDNASMTGEGIRSVVNQGVILRNNHTINTGNRGILTGFSVDLLIENNITEGAGREHGIYVGNSDSPNDNVTVRGNLVRGNFGNGIQFNGDCWAGGDGTLDGNVIENNIVHTSGVKGLSMISIRNTRIQNNVIYNNGTRNIGAGGIHLADEPGCGNPSDNNVVVNNTIVESRIAVLRITDGSNNVIFNNIGVNGSGRFFIDESGGTNHIDAGSNLARTSTAGLFENVSNHDYHLETASPGIDIGRSTYQSQTAPGADRDGNSRPQNGVFDAGAYEFASTPNNPPTIVNPAAAAPNPVTGTTTDLSVLGADDGGEASLTYTWSAVSSPAAVSFNPNGTNAAKNSVATFTRAGTYTLRATLRDAGGRTVTSDVAVTVTPTFSSVVVTPANAQIQINTTRQYTAAARDQFGTNLAVQPSFTWTVTGGGTVSSAGLLTAAGIPGGPFTIAAEGGGRLGSAPFTVTEDPPAPEPPPSSGTPNERQRNFIRAGGNGWADIPCTGAAVYDLAGQRRGTVDGPVWNGDVDDQPLPTGRYHVICGGIEPFTVIIVR